MITTIADVLLGAWFKLQSTLLKLNPLGLKELLRL